MPECWTGNSTAHTHVGYLSIIPRTGTELVCNATWRSWTPTETDCEFIFRRCCISQMNNRDVVTRYRQQAHRTRMQNCRQIRMRRCVRSCRSHSSSRFTAALLTLPHLFHVVDVVFMLLFLLFVVLNAVSNTPLNIHFCHLWHRFFHLISIYYYSSSREHCCASKLEPPHSHNGFHWQWCWSTVLHTSWKLQ